MNHQSRADIDWPGLSEPVARAVWGHPSFENPRELRWGTRGSRKLDRATGTWFDHERNIGGGTLDLVPGIDNAERMRWLQEQQFIRGEAPQAQPKPTIAATYNYTDEAG